MSEEVNHHSFIEHIPVTLRGLIDIASFGVILGTLFNHLPQIAAGLSIIWTLMRLGNEFATWRERRRRRRG